MKIALAQTPASKGDIAENFETALDFARMAKQGGAKLAVFPEMFLTGFNYEKNLNALKDGADFAEKLCAVALNNSMYVAGSVPWLEPGAEKPSNRMILAGPRGDILAGYDKIHLFGKFKEDLHVAGGAAPGIVETPFGKIGLTVCYDLRFAELYVSMALAGAEIILVSAAWPAERIKHFKALALARAIETQCFVACVNQAGPEDFGKKKICYGGGSAVFDPWGETVCGLGEEPGVETCRINMPLIEKSRAEIPALKDRKPQYYRL